MVYVSIINLKCAIHWFLLYVQSCAPIHHHNPIKEYFNPLLSPKNLEHISDYSPYPTKP